VVQKDTDVPLISPAESTVFFPSTIQVPTVEYSFPTDEILNGAFLDHWTMKCEKLTQG